jgi:hypothetical protein
VPEHDERPHARISRYSRTCSSHLQFGGGRGDGGERERFFGTAIRAKTLWSLVGLRDAQQVLGVLPFLDNGRT